MSSNKVVVECNNGWGRALLRLDVIAFPFWGFFCPAYLTCAYLTGTYNQAVYGIPVVLICPMAIYLGYRGLETLLTNKLEIRKSDGTGSFLDRLRLAFQPPGLESATITLPHPRRGVYNLCDLEAVHLECVGEKARYLCLDFRVDASLRHRFKHRKPDLKRLVGILKAGKGGLAGKIFKKELLALPGLILGSLSGAPALRGYKVRVTEKISVSRISKSNGKSLAQGLERMAPGCSIDENCLNYLAGKHRDQHGSARLVKDGLEIRYHSHEKIGRIAGLLTTHEWLFWSVFLACCALFVVVFSPVIMHCATGIVKKLLGDESRANLWPDEYSPWFNMWGSFAQTAVNTLQKPGELYFNLVNNPVSSLCLLAICLLFGMRLWHFLMQPNILKLTPEGFTLQCRLGVKVISSRTYKWSALNRVTLQKPRGATAPERWRMAFHTADGKRPVELRLSALEENDRETILRYVESHAEHITRDPEIIETLMPAQKASYTELWLQALSTPPKRERLAPLSSGQVLRGGRFVVEGQLGTGGQGIAYLATRADGFDDLTTGSAKIVVKEFVLPVFVDKAARRRALERFENETAMLCQLDHPQIVKLIDYFIEDHRGYLVLEHINGKSLRQIVEAEGPLDEKRVIELSAQMCSILQYLHSRVPPLVHRDFTPDNLILSDKGILKLIDFNVAHQSDSRSQATVVGKHAYLPPEQFRGKPEPASDLYALGATMAYLLTGHDPDPVSTTHPILEREELDGRLDSIVACLTALNTRDRYEDATAALAGLKELLTDEPGEVISIQSENVTQKAVAKEELA